MLNAKHRKDFGKIKLGSTNRSLWLISLAFKILVGRRSKDDERQINIWKKIVSRLRGKLVKMIKDAVSK